MDGYQLEPINVWVTPRDHLLLDVYVNALSGYSYLGLAVLQRYKSLWGMELNVVPVILPKVISEAGNSPPGFDPNRAKYMTKDLLRGAKLVQVPYSGAPRNHPGAPLEKGMTPYSSTTLDFLVVATS